MKKIVSIYILFVLITMGCKKNEDVKKILADRLIFIPTVFVPDGWNNVFLPAGFGITTVVEYSMKIFDFDGHELFKSNDVNIGWNGLNNDGHAFPNGLYLYDIWFLFDDGEEITAKGTVEISQKGW